MIEKLDFHCTKGKEQEYQPDLVHLIRVFNLTQDKINELVEAHNKLEAEYHSNKHPHPVLDERSDETIEDGFGSTWSAWCPKCGKKTMSVVRPGKVQCDNCN